MGAAEPFFLSRLHVPKPSCAARRESPWILLYSPKLRLAGLGVYLFTVNMANDCFRPPVGISPQEFHRSGRFGAGGAWAVQADTEEGATLWNRHF